MGSKLICTCFYLFVVSMVVGSCREILIDDEGPIVKNNNIQSLGNEEDANEETNGPCHMEYQVMKRVAGHCIKLGRSAKGCVAGNYLHPFHPECM